MQGHFWPLKERLLKISPEIWNTTATVYLQLRTESQASVIYKVVFFLMLFFSIVLYNKKFHLSGFISVFFSSLTFLCVMRQIFSFYLWQIQTSLFLIILYIANLVDVNVEFASLQVLKRKKPSWNCRTMQRDSTAVFITREVMWCKVNLYNYMASWTNLTSASVSST